MTNEKWNLTKLDDCAEIVMGQSPKGEYYNDKGIGTPLINGPADYGRKNPGAKQWTAQVTKLCEVGDILFCVRGATVGKMNLADAQYCIGRGVAAIRGMPGKSMSEYVWYALQFQMNNIVQMSKGSGTTFPNISSNDLKKLMIPLPPLPEQQRIASILSAADKAIEEAGLAVEESERIKIGLMQKLIPNDKANPEKWNCVRLDDICDVQTGPFGAQLHQRDYVDTGSPMITVEHLGMYGITKQNLPCVSDDDKNRLSRFILHKGDIVFSRVGSVDRNCLITEEEDGWLFSGRLLRIRPLDQDKIDSKYLSYYFHTQDFITMIKNHSVGGVMPSLNTKLMSEVRIILPPVEEQIRISTLLSVSDDRVILSQKRKAILEKMKQGLMQTLLSNT